MSDLSRREGKAFNTLPIEAALDHPFSAYASPAHPNGHSSDNSVLEKKFGVGADSDKETTLHEQKFHKLGWQRLAICLIVEAIALGALSIPAAFATVGMVAGIILTVGFGFIAIYTSYIVGQVKLKFPQVMHYADAVGLIWGRFGYELTGAMFAVFLVLIVGSHVLTGTIAFATIADTPGVCALVWAVVSAILLFILSLPPTFSEFAILGYIDFVSICAAVLITIVATGVEASSKHGAGGLNTVPWSVWPPEGVTFSSAFLSVTNIIFAYSFAVCQFSFMAELKEPKDYVKSIWVLGLAEIFIYTITGALIYAFVGPNVSSPALLSASGVVPRVAFGVAIPVIFISGSINGTVVGKYIMGRVFADSPKIRFIYSPRAWIIWSGLLASLTVIAWVVAEAIPFFSDLLGIISSLFISGFDFYFPALFWFILLKEGKWNANWKNIGLSVTNALLLGIGIATLGCGTYASVQDIINKYAEGKVRSPFTCDSAGFT